MAISSTLKSIARKTTPVIWAIPMATGCVSALFFAFPYGQGSQVMAILSLAFYLLNIGLFLLFNASTIACFAMDPGSFLRFLRNPRYSFFFSCYPIGATTLIVVSINVVYGYYGVGGKKFLYFIWVLWWMNVVLCALCLWGTTHWMITRHTHTLSGMTAAWILPIASFTVASSTGAITSQAIHEFSIHGALVTVTVSAYLLSTGLFLGTMIFTVYLMRLVVYGFPPGLSVLSVFAPVGVSIQAGLAVSLIGAEFRLLLPMAGSSSLFLTLGSSGDAIHNFACIGAFIFWTWAVLWIIYGVMGMVHTFRREEIPFKLTAWGLVFPNGGFASLSIHLAKVFDSGFFRVVGAVYAILTLFLWCFLAYNTTLLIPHLFRNKATKAIHGEDAKKSEPENKESIPIDSTPTSHHYPNYRTFTSQSRVSYHTLGDEYTLIGWRLAV